MNSPKKYRLLKDLPDYKAGEIFIENGWYKKDDVRRRSYSRAVPVVGGISYPDSIEDWIIENNPTFFEEVKEEPAQEFKWDEATAVEFANWYKDKQGCSHYWGKDLLKLFKESKQQPVEEKPVLFTSFDGVAIFEGDDYYTVDNENSIWRGMARSNDAHSQNNKPNDLFFSTKQAAQAYIDSKKEGKSIKPPLGLMPEWFWKEKRLQDIKDAIRRYLTQSQIPIPSEWIAEQSLLEEQIQSRNEQLINQ